MKRLDSAAPLTTSPKSTTYRATVTGFTGSAPPRLAPLLVARDIVARLVARGVTKRAPRPPGMGGPVLVPNGGYSTPVCENAGFSG